MAAIFDHITSSEQLDRLIQESYGHPVAIVKHSNTCGISANIMYNLRDIDGEINVIVVQDHRDVSNAAEVRFGHRHQSPQAFVIVDGKPVYHATHYGIDPERIEAALKAGVTP